MLKKTIMIIKKRITQRKMVSISIVKEWLQDKEDQF